VNSPIFFLDPHLIHGLTVALFCLQ